MSFKHVLCAGAGTVDVDSGLPRVGELYGVQSTGDLHWYRYDGNGERSSGSVGWASNSGNRIGKGWARFRSVVGGGDGVMFAVEPDGDLRWYQYVAGDGVEDRDATRGWHPNSQNPIGNGWDMFAHVVCTPRFGVTFQRRQLGATLYGVEPNGDLRWYRYVGGGEADRSGVKGWVKNSGNQIGNGWGEFRILTAASTDLFAVDSEGLLRWYRYSGDGTADPSGNIGWHANSGNIIGRGWERFSKIVGGPDDHSRSGIALYAVEPSGTLRWHKYFGNGEVDPAGANWHARSGTRIGNGW